MLCMKASVYPITSGWMWSWPVPSSTPSVLLLQAEQTLDLDLGAGGTVEYAQRRSARGW